MPSDAAQPWVLRTVHFGCRLPAQLFAYRGHSIFSKGAGRLGLGLGLGLGFGLGLGLGLGLALALALG